VTETLKFVLYQAYNGFDNAALAGPILVRGFPVVAGGCGRASAGRVVLGLSASCSGCGLMLLW